MSFASQALIGHIKARLPAGGDAARGNSGGKVKRMLPIPPGMGSAAANTGKRILRCQSAKARISRNVSMMDLSTSNSADNL